VSAVGARERVTAPGADEETTMRAVRGVRVRRLVAVTLVTGVVAAGCAGSDGSGGSGAEGVTTTASVAAASSTSAVAAPAGGGSAPSPVPPTPATTDPATTVPETTVPFITVPFTTAPAPSIPAGGLTAACLQGEWILDQGTTDLFFSTLLPFAPVSVPEGSVSMTFDGDRVRYFINVTIKFTLPDGFVQAPFDQLQEGTYTIVGSEVLIDVTSTTGGYGGFTGVLGGVAVDVPGTSFGPVPPVSGGPARCSGDEFSLQYTSGVSDAVAYFTRAR
jgi:hypothetical protein